MRSLVPLLLLAACAPAAERGAADVDAERIINADAEPGNWMAYGRSYDEQRFSPLDQINDSNAEQLGLAWHVDLDTARGQEATPIVVDGVMYVTTAWSKVMALNAATGAVLWRFDPEVPGEAAVKGCCDVVNRGVAVWQGKVFVGAFDGRLIALDAKSGRKLWETVTVDQSKPYTITGAPRVVKGKVLIGNGGAELGVRGYLSAYDAETGAMAWRFYTVPGDPAKGFESKALEAAAQTWTGEWWKQGGGGTVWDSMAYDPKLDLLYIGVGNGSPWDRNVRSPGGGDNLFLSSIVAVRPDTGEYVWHFQTTPGDTWDYTATQHMILADLKIAGQVRPVIMQAPKNGFFYVLDRRTGEFISGKPIVRVNWATGLDARGRPIEVAAARYTAGNPWLSLPGPNGAHNWQPMAFSPKTGLVYIPAQDAAAIYKADPKFRAQKIGFNTATDMTAEPLPKDPAARKAFMAGVRGFLLAWDPVAQREVWRVPHPGTTNGGILATAGNLVVQGNAAGRFGVYRATDGKTLWTSDVQTASMAPPVTYMVDGVQYIAASVGTGGGHFLLSGAVSEHSGKQRNISRIVAFRLNGKKSLPPRPVFAEGPLAPPPMTGTPAQVTAGKRAFHKYCSVCHGGAAHSGGVIPDLRHSATLGNDAWYDVVMDGVLKDRGMVSFASELSRDQVTEIRHYVVSRAHEDSAAAPMSNE
ncbi:PQQ-dependent dehydrogenase, methanol/ethanol family [Blastomonas fulva]|uniref:PQQ-dependent dehydrogenase, methanol/ethanol family n=1 Tax=Blastomonas fulva TaxID=1550728 RepID=UPI003F71089C